MKDSFTPFILPQDKSATKSADGFTPVSTNLMQKYEAEKQAKLDAEKNKTLSFKERFAKIDSEYKAKASEADARQASGEQGKISTGIQKFGAGVKDVAEKITSPIQYGVDEIGNLIKAGREKQAQMDDERIANGTLKPEDALSRKPHIEDQLGALVSKGLQTDQANKIREYYDSLSPEAKANVTGVTDLLSGAFDLATLGVGKKVIETGGKKVVENAILKSAEAVTKQTAKQSEKALITTIEAINPELKGKKLIDAYKDVGKGNRQVEGSGILKGQDVSPDKRTLELAERVTNLGLGKDPAKNLNIIEKNFKETEDKLTKALDGDPEINYNAGKDTLFKKLDNIKKTAPREFSAIKDSKKVYDDVINFSSKIIKESDDSIKGLRDARTAFDAQAHKEYPTAFKDGGIDTKTPAGRAIKDVRDALNDHLYETAPNGSEIKNLVGQEADLFRLIDSIAPKAAKGQGKNKIEQFIADHPLISKYIPWALGGYGAYNVAKGVTGE